MALIVRELSVAVRVESLQHLGPVFAEIGLVKGLPLFRGKYAVAIGVEFFVHPALVPGAPRFPSGFPFTRGELAVSVGVELLEHLPSRVRRPLYIIGQHGCCDCGRSHARHEPSTLE